MTVFDYVILAAIGLSGLLGFVRGFLKELMSLIAYLLAAVAALWWGPEAATWLESLIETSLLRSAVAYVVVFIITLLAVGLVNMTLSALIERTGLGPADHGFGMMFGLARGALLILLLVILAGYTQLPAEPWWQESQLVGIAINAAIGLKSYLPADIASWLPYSSS